MNPAPPVTRTVGTWLGREEPECYKNPAAVSNQGWREPRCRGGPSAGLSVTMTA
jgi:hypothetical protein